MLKCARSQRVLQIREAKFDPRAVAATNPHQDIDKALQARMARGRIFIRCRPNAQRVAKIRATPAN